MVYFSGRFNLGKIALEHRQEDVRNLMETVNNLDLKYIESWVSQLGLEQVYKKVKS